MQLDPTVLGARSGWTLLELLVVVAIIAVLMAVLLPAVISARASAQRVQCLSNLRTIGQALMAYESNRQRLPAGRDERGGRDHSWATAILPYIDEQPLYDRYDWSRRWNDGSGLSHLEVMDYSKIKKHVSEYQGNLAVAATNLPVFLCPSTVHNHLGATDYGGSYGSTLTGLPAGLEKGMAWESGTLTSINLIDADRSSRASVSMREISDGASHTFLVLEDAGRSERRAGMWANGHNCLGQDQGPINRRRASEIYSDHTGVAHALLADGSLMVLTPAIDSFVLGALSTRAGREHVAEID